MDGKTREFIKGYLPEDILNMDELEKGKKGRGGKQNKKRCTIVLFVAANGSKVCDPIVVWRSKKPHCFKNLTNIFRQHRVHYFANAEAWITNEIMQEVLRMLNKKMIAECRKVLLFLDNSPSHSTFSSEV